MMAGLQPSDLIIVARPAMGKTAFALNMASTAAMRHGKTAGVFSLEMSHQQLFFRLLCSEARVDAHRLRTGRINKDDWQRIIKTYSELAETSIYIDDTPGMGIMEMRAKSRRLKLERGLDLLIVDYLQLMQGRERRDSRQQEISDISRSLKELAKELQIPVIALSQLSRAPEQRTGDRRPRLSDLRESGAIEQDADVVLFLFREEVYKKDDPDLRGKAEIIIGEAAQRTHRGRAARLHPRVHPVRERRDVPGGRMTSGTLHVCQQCGYQSRKWLGKCPECATWGSLSRRSRPATRRPPRGEPGRGTAAPLPGDPGIRRGAPEHRIGARPRARRRPRGGGGHAPRRRARNRQSTLLLQTASALAESGTRVLYATGEESVAQLRLRGDRLGVRSRDLLVLAETDVDTICARAREAAAHVLVVDSIQAVRCADLASLPGSVAQVREAAARLVALAKSSSVPVFLVGHVTKDDSLAGPRLLEHVVDTVIQFEGDRHLAHRLLRSLKNRFGPSDEIAVFSMSEDGLRGVTSPSELFLAERPQGAAGSAVLAALEGTRPLLVEVQALVGEPIAGSPRRTALGVDGNRVAMILAVLERRAGVQIGARDVFVNVTGGLSVVDPAADLAVCAAAASSLRSVPLPEHWVIMGEIGLTERSAPSGERRRACGRRAGSIHRGRRTVPSAAPDGMTIVSSET
jgi:DNA repair protein RadA/Sms